MLKHQFANKVKHFSRLASTLLPQTTWGQPNWVFLFREYQQLKKKLARYESIYQKPSLVSYQAAFSKEISGLHTYQRKDDDWISNRLTNCQVILHADTHSDAVTQRSALEILFRLIEHKSDITLVLEWIPNEFQYLIDRYFKDEISLSTIADQIESSNFWPFPLTGYLAILTFAKQHNLKILLPESMVSDIGLTQRDGQIVTAMKAHLDHAPNTTFFVLYGTYHIWGKDHLKDLISKKLNLKALTFLAANVDHIFWSAIFKYQDLQKIKYLLLSREIVYHVCDTPLRTLNNILEYEIKVQTPSWDELMDELEIEG